MAQVEKNTGNVIFAQRQKYYIDPNTGNHVNVGNPVTNDPYANPLGDNIGPVDAANVNGITCPVATAHILRFVGASTNQTVNICTASEVTVYQQTSNFAFGEDLYADESLSTTVAAGWYGKLSGSGIVNYGYWDSNPGTLNNPTGLISVSYGKTCPANVTIPKP